jgi:Mannosyltransferase (PIG-V)
MWRERESWIKQGCRENREMPQQNVAQSALAESPAVSRPRWIGRLAEWSLRAGPIGPARLTRGEWLYIGSLFFLSRALILFLGVVGSAMFPEVGPGQTWVLAPISGHGLNSWTRVYVHFDSGWYLGIAHGYLLPTSGNPDWLKEWAFFPFYPLVIAPVSAALRLLHVPGNTGEIAGVLVSHAALFGALVYLFRLVRTEMGAAEARRASTYVLIFPTSLFLSAVYPEGLFLLLSTGAFYHARRRQWALAGVLAAGATLTRVQGLFLLVPLALELASDWRQRGQWRKSASMQGLWLGLPVVALAGYALYSHAKTGYWLAFVAAGHAWGRTPTPPVYPLVRYLLAPTLGSAFRFDFSAVNFATAIGFAALGVVALRRLPPAYGLWLWVALLVPLSSGGHQLTSLTRYAVTIFPAFVAMAAWSLRSRWTPDGPVMEDGASVISSDLRDRVIVMPSLLLLALFVLMFTNGVYAAV